MYSSNSDKNMKLSVKCMVFHDNKILLLQKKDKEALLPWEFPGGGLEFGEDFAEAAKREVKEEAGLDIDIIEIAGLWSYARTEDTFLTGIIFITKTANDKVILSDEHVSYRWVTPHELKHYKLQDSLIKALKNIKVIDRVDSNLRKIFVEGYNG